MEYANWDEEEWLALLYAIWRKDCILMLGPDIPCEQVHGHVSPLAEILANELAEHISVDVASWHLDPSNLAQIAQYYQMEYGSSALEAKVYSFYRSKQHVVTAFYQNLASLPFYFVATSTPDNLLYNALKETGKDPIIHRYHFRGTNPEMIPMGTVNNPLLFYLYGILEEPESLVLTENDLLDFLMAMILQDPPLPINVLSELREKKKSLLFLGCGFKHWYLRLLLRVIQKEEKASHSFALEKSIPQNEANAFRSTILFYKKSQYKIQIYYSNLQSFVNELRERYDAQYASVSLSPGSVKKKPKILICNMTKDSQHARFLATQLETAGFQAYIDENSTRDSEHLDLSIKQAIQDCDYFAVLQSQSMVGDHLNGQELPPELRQQVVNFLTSLPNIHDSDGKRAWIYRAELGSALQNQIDFDKPIEQFFQLLVTTLRNYGRLRDGRNALEAVLEASKDLLGEDKKDECDMLIQELRAPRERLYIAQEISFALECWRTHKHGKKFIIPTKIDQCSALQALQEFETIDISQQENITKLIALIGKE